MLKTRRLKTCCGLGFLCVIFIFLTSCVSWIVDQPSIVVQKVVITPLSFTEVNLLIDLDVRNPNRFDLTLKSFHCTIAIDKEELGKGSLQEKILVPSSSTTRIQVPVGVKLQDLGSSLKNILRGGDLPYKVEGKADIGTVFGSFAVTFAKEGPLGL
ncbi:MAG: LEA type 2 family protein [Deltaproteobacteria bacterium]|nr:LEA type 2 family protein [Deltaproteobacteria bacterium]